MRDLSPRYQRIMLATGCSKEQLDRQPGYMIDAMDFLTRRIEELEERIATSTRLTPMEERMSRGEIYSEPGCKVHMPGIGTYCFPLESRVSFRASEGAFDGWSIRHMWDGLVEKLHINGPRLVVRPRASNDVELERDMR